MATLRFGRVPQPRPFPSQALEGEALHPCYLWLYDIARIPGWLRPAIAWLLRRRGEARKAALFLAGRGRTAYNYWQLVVRRDAMQFRANAEACPSFARYLSEAHQAGVKVIARRVRWGEADGEDLGVAIDDGSLPVSGL